MGDRPMIAAIACCPCTALLVPEAAGIATPEMDEVRAACDRAVATLLETGVEAVVVLGPAIYPQPLKNMTPGLPLPAFAELPLPHALAAYLLERAGWSGPVRYAPVPDTGEPIPPLGKAAARTGLLIMGDGSARRGEKAPGYLDARAEPFDDAVAAALATGDSGALAGLDAELGRELLVAGVGPWKALGALGAVGALNGLWHADLLYSGVPFGVAYVVAAWTPAG
jgi:hypothetical protein